MIDWIFENKSWLFSGVGILIIAGLYSLIKKFFKKKNTEKVSSDSLLTKPLSQKELSKTSPIEIIDSVSLQTESLSQKKLTNISPIEIYNSVKDLPPLQKEINLDNFCGLFVEWKTKLALAKKINNDKSLVYLILLYPVDQYNNINITCCVNADLYKELFITKKDADILVSGEIERIDDISTIISLINAKISIIEFDIQTNK